MPGQEPPSTPAACKRLLVVSHAYATLEPRKKLHALSAHCSILCVTVDTLTTGLNQAIATEPLSQAGLEIRPLPRVGAKNAKTRYLLRGLKRVFREWNPDLVLIEAEPWSWIRWQVWWCKLLSGSKAPLFEFSWENFERPGWKGWILRWFYRAVAWTSSGVICGNQAATEIFRKVGLPAEKILVCPQLGVDEAVFTPVSPEEKSRLREAAGIPPTAKLIGFCGRFLEEKGIRTLLHAMEAIRQEDPECELALLGDGPLAGWLREQQSTRPWLHLLPPCTHAEVAGFLQMLDVFVLPSENSGHWREQFGHVLIEAMACGVPVVGSDCGAIPEVIGESGLIFPQGNSPALANCIRQTLEAPTSEIQPVALRERALREFTNPAIARRWADFFSSRSKPLALVLSDHYVPQTKDRPRRYLEQPVDLEFARMEMVVAQRSRDDEDLHAKVPLVSSATVMKYWGIALSFITLLKALPRLREASYVICNCPHHFWELAWLTKWKLVNPNNWRRVQVVLFRSPGFQRKKKLFDSLPNCFRVFFINAKQVEEARDGLTDPERVQHLPWKIDTTWYRPKIMSPSDDNSYFLVPGNWLREEEFIKELSLEVPWKIVRAGRMGSLRDTYKQAILNGNVEVKTNLSHREYLALLQGAATVLLPIRPCREPAGLTALLEAMACGIPVIANDSMEVGEVFRKAYGEEPLQDFQVKEWVAQLSNLRENGERWLAKTTQARHHILTEHSMGSDVEDWSQYLEKPASGDSTNDGWKIPADMP